MFTSRQIKHSRLLLRHARKYLRYKHDKLSDVDREQIVSEMQTLREALRSRDRQNIHTGHVGIALARKLRSDFGCDRDRGGDSLLFSSAIQNSDRLDATDVKRNYRSSDHRAGAKYPAAGPRIRSSGSQLHRRSFA